MASLKLFTNNFDETIYKDVDSSISSTSGVYNLFYWENSIWGPNLESPIFSGTSGQVKRL